MGMEGLYRAAYEIFGCLLIHYSVSINRLKMFQVYDCALSYLLRGTMGLCTVGMAYWGYLMYRMAYGIK